MIELKKDSKGKLRDTLTNRVIRMFEISSAIVYYPRDHELEFHPHLIDKEYEFKRRLETASPSADGYLLLRSDSCLSPNWYEVAFYKRLKKRKRTKSRKRKK